MFACSFIVLLLGVYNVNYRTTFSNLNHRLFRLKVNLEGEVNNCELNVIIVLYNQAFNLGVGL